MLYIGILIYAFLFISIVLALIFLSRIASALKTISQEMKHQNTKNLSKDSAKKKE